MTTREQRVAKFNANRPVYQAVSLALQKIAKFVKV